MTFSVCLLAATLLTNLLDIVSAVSNGKRDINFRVEGSILAVSPGESALLALASSGKSMVFRDVTPGRISRTFVPGNVVCAFGKVSVNEYEFPAANCDRLVRIATGTKPDITDVTAAQLQTESFDGRLIRVCGTVKNVFRDEIDPKYVYLALVEKGIVFHVSICDDGMLDVHLESIIDAWISVTGVYSSMRNGLRKLSGCMIAAYSTESIRILRPAPADPYDVPSITDGDPTTPAEVARMGKRRTTGHVIAVRNGKDILIRDKSGSPRRIRLRNTPCPAYGATIEAIGYAETDLYRINLSDAVWRETSDTGPLDDGPPADVDVAAILTDGKGTVKINPTFHGRAIRIRGTVMDLPGDTSPQGIITVRSGDFTIPVDISANRSAADVLSIGCTIAVAGICIVETDHWRPFSTFPHATGITLVVRKPSDISILSRPPWWTPQRLLVLISSLILAMIAVIIWNRWLNRLVSRRSRALVKEQLALAEAELKVGERTRLAIDLHDSLSQNLAAVACQVAATKSAVKINAAETMENLNTTERMLLSCRSELRRCLWDLRNDTLDEQNMTEVIRKVLAPVLGQAELQIRFNVSRARLDDSTLHSVICIIRELASNAMTHGQATHLTVAGDLDGEILAFSVNENGKGFDPGTCDGPAEGHFGLAGIRERIERLRGTFTLKSHPGGGSYTKITFRLPSNNVED